MCSGHSGKGWRSADKWSSPGEEVDQLAVGDTGQTWEVKTNDEGFVWNGHLQQSLVPHGVSGDMLVCWYCWGSHMELWLQDCRSWQSFQTCWSTPKVGRCWQSMHTKELSEWRPDFRDFRDDFRDFRGARVRRFWMTNLMHEERQNKNKNQKLG